jgi:hypothetical protein
MIGPWTLPFSERGCGLLRRRSARRQQSLVLQRGTHSKRGSGVLDFHQSMLRPLVEFASQCQAPYRECGLCEFGKPTACLVSMAMFPAGM